MGIDKIHDNEKTVYAGGHDRPGGIHGASSGKIR